MPLDIFLKIEGVDGESADPRHPNQIRVMALSIGAAQPGYDTSAGLGAGKVNVTDLTIVKLIDKSTPKLFTACCTGQHIPSLQATFRRVGSQQDFFLLIATDIVVSSQQISGKEADEGTEAVSFNCSRIQFKYLLQKADGTLAGEIGGGYDLRKNIKI